MINNESKQLLDNLIFGISYDADKNAAVVWINSSVYLTGRIRELSPTQRGKFLQDLNDLALLYLVCKGNKKLQKQIIKDSLNDKKRY